MTNDSRRPVPRHPSAGNLAAPADRPVSLVPGDGSVRADAVRDDAVRDDAGPDGAGPPVAGSGEASVGASAGSGARPTDAAPVGTFWLNFPDGDGTDEPRLEFGPDLDHAWLARLLGNVTGRVILELGCGNGTRAVCLASLGAKVIAVDPSADNLVAARRLAEHHDVAVEFHQSDLAELAFIRAERVDACLSVYALARSTELSRVFRQVHRVVRQDAPMVVSLPHPTALQCRSEEGPPTVVRAADDPSPLRWEIAGDPRGGGAVMTHRAADVFSAFRTSNFRVDTFLEPMAERLATGASRSPYWQPLFDWVPSTLIVRARKEGS